MILKEIKDNRKIFKDMGMNKWREIGMNFIKEGDRFRIYSRALRPLELGGEETLVAIADAYQVDDLWAVEVKETVH
jgi:hypothetical protein